MPTDLKAMCERQGAVVEAIHLLLKQWEAESGGKYRLYAKPEYIDLLPAIDGEGRRWGRQKRGTHLAITIELNEEP